MEVFQFRKLTAAPEIGHTIRIKLAGTENLFAGILLDLNGDGLTNPFEISDDLNWGFSPDDANARLDVFWEQGGINIAEGVTFYDDSLAYSSFTSAGAAGDAHSTVPHFPMAAVKDPTGFLDNSAIIRTYDKASRKLTLTGDLRYLWNGKEFNLESPWTSPTAHDVGDGIYFLSSTDGITFTWSKTEWKFYHMMAGVAVVKSTDAFGVSEVHGLRSWMEHREAHTFIGTHRVSGLGPTSGTFVLNSAVDSDTTPGFDSGVIRDEDLDTNIAATIEGTYTTMRIGAGGVSVFDLAANFPFRSSGSFLLINNPANGSESPASNNRFVNVYELLVPVTGDANSQKYRRILVQPQASFSSLAAANAEDTRGLILGSLGSPEFFIYSRLTYSTSSSNSNTGKVRLARITYVMGGRATQLTTYGGSTPTAENVPYTPTSPDTSVNVQAALDSRLRRENDSVKAISEFEKTDHVITGPGQNVILSYLNGNVQTITATADPFLITKGNDWPLSAASMTVYVKAAAGCGGITWSGFSELAAGSDGTTMTTRGRYEISSIAGDFFIDTVEEA